MVDVHFCDGYNDRTLVNDLAIIILDRDIPNAQWASLPGRNTDPRTSRCSKLYIMGWGSTLTEEIADELQYTSLPVLPQNVGQNMFGLGDPQGRKFPWDRDSGGPAIMGTDTIVGVAADGNIDPDATLTSSTRVYESRYGLVSLHLPWIISYMG